MALSAEEKRRLEREVLEAAAAGDAAAIERLVGEGASPDAKDRNLHSAVSNAAFWGQTAAVEALLRLGADPNATAASTGITPLMRTAIRGHLEIARLLLEAGADAALRETWVGR